MKRICSLTKRENGFTLVEVIVVLVILAILAALLVPRLTGWIDKSKQDAAIAQGQIILKAANTAVSQAYAYGASQEDRNANVRLYWQNSDQRNATLFRNLLGNEIDLKRDGKGHYRLQPNPITSTAGKIDWFSYECSNGYTVTYRNGAFTAAKTA